LSVTKWHANPVIGVSGSYSWELFGASTGPWPLAHDAQDGWQAPSPLTNTLFNLVALPPIFFLLSWYVSYVFPGQGHGIPKPYKFALVWWLRWVKVIVLLFWKGLCALANTLWTSITAIEESEWVAHQVSWVGGYE
jgi:hypothetical protein